MPKRPPMKIEFVASPRPDAEEKHKAVLALLARGVVEQNHGEHALPLKSPLGNPRSRPGAALPDLPPPTSM